MIFYTFLLWFAAAAYTQEPPPSISTNIILPVYVSLEPNIHNFSLFADGGPNANWYVGFNNAWIVKLPSAPAGQFTRAFIGAKLGRAKTNPDPDHPWRRVPINGKIYMAISESPAFSPEQSYFLAQTTDLPFEPDLQSNVADVGASRWFWAAVPLNQINFNAPNYLIIWSPTPDLDSAADSPILAASDRASNFCDDACAWNNNSLQGSPPRQAADSLETPLGNLFPAMAIELVPRRGEEKVRVSELFISPQDSGMVASFSVSGQDVSQAWLETSQDALEWHRVGLLLHEPPYIFTLAPGEAPKSGEYLRGAAQDIAGDEGYSPAYAVP